MNLLDKIKFKRQIDENVEQNGRPIFLPGDKAQLNYKKIKADPNYKRLTMARKAFIGRHKNDVFTVEYDAKFGASPSVVCFEEDKHDPKWLWMIGHLMPADKNSLEKV